jgi:predicted Zn-dependent peptidase
MRRLLPLALLLTTALTAAHAAGPTRVVLPNGLVVIAVADRTSAIAGLHLAARYDPVAARPGLAALSQQALQLQLADLLREDPWQELGQQVRGTHAVLLANTEHDYCEVRAKVTSDLLPQALQLAAKVLLGQVAPSAEQLQGAREVLLASQRDGSNAVIEGTYNCFLKALFGRRSWLARPVQGSTDALSALTAAYMTPNHAVLTLIGPRATDELVDLARLAAGPYPAGAAAVAPAPAAVAPQPRVCVAQQPGWRGVSLMVGVPAPTYGTPDFLKAQLIYTLLEGKGGRLAEDTALRGGLGLNRIANRGQEPPAVTVLPPMAQPRPVLILHMVVMPRQMELARQELLKHFEVLKVEPPTAAELARAKARLVNSYARLRLDPANMTKALSCCELYGGDVALAWRADDLIEAITGDDLVAVAKQYFGLHAIGVLMPGDE